MYSISISNCQTKLFQNERTQNITEGHIPRYCFFLVRDNNICIFDSLVLQAILKIRANLKYFHIYYYRKAFYHIHWWYTDVTICLPTNILNDAVYYQYNKKQKQINYESRIVIFELTGICPC